MKKYVLITGASGGIGNEITRQLLRNGYGVYAHYNQNIEGIQQIIKEFPNEEAFIVHSDLSKGTGVEKLLSQLHHSIDHLVLCSGNTFYGLITDMTHEEIEESIQLHITSPFTLTKHLLPSMIYKKEGNIVVISSIWGNVGASCEVLYSMLKGGQNSFVKALAKEVAPSNIRVNAVAPGAIDTSMLSHFSEEELVKLKEEIPMGRLGKPIEIAEMVLFLLSEKVPYLSGQILTVDGAWYT
ncbi:elongation factor P 5-aminopentanone reductase [Bacillus salitolerans]|uniref:Elongation factor P 5-aminopentanone reductase n=1 Tax=Bacillus salitolerans TaxID=1437434 RepID=A0ABW4LL19_9BACI